MSYHATGAQAGQDDSHRGRCGPGRRPDRPPDPGEDLRRRRHRSARHPHPRRAARPPAGRAGSHAFEGDRRCRSARSTSRSTATISASQATRALGHTDMPGRRHRRPAGDPRRRRALLRPYRPGRARRAQGPRPAPLGAARRPRRPRPPGAADPRRLRRQEHPHLARPRASACCSPSTTAATGADPAGHRVEPNGGAK